MGGLIIGAGYFGQYSAGGTVPDDVPPFGREHDLLATAGGSQALLASTEMVDAEE
jgi:hypothetical protein